MVDLTQGYALGRVIGNHFGRCQCNSSRHYRTLTMMHVMVLLPGSVTECDIGPATHLDPPTDAQTADEVGNKDRQ